MLASLGPKLVSTMLLFATSTLVAATKDIDYSDLKGAQAPASSTLAVTHYFSYYCGQCAQVAPALRSWFAKLPRDVTTLQVIVPIKGQAGSEPSQRTALALQTLPNYQTLDAAIYQAIHTQRRSFPNEQSFVSWLQTQGVSSEAFKKSIASFTLLVRLEQSRAWFKTLTESTIENIPVIVVDGKYVVPLSTSSRTIEQRLATVDALIQRARAERAVVATKPPSTQMLGK